GRMLEHAVAHEDVVSVVGRDDEEGDAGVGQDAGECGGDAGLVEREGAGQFQTTPATVGDDVGNVRRVADDGQLIVRAGYGEKRAACPLRYCGIHMQADDGVVAGDERERWTRCFHRYSLLAHAADGVDELLRLERLLYHGWHLAGKCIDEGIGRCGEEDRPLEHGRVVHSKVADDGHASFVRHHQVEEEHVVGGALYRGDGLPAGEEDIDAKALAPEDLGHEALHGGIVFEKEYAFAGFEEHGVGVSSRKDCANAAQGSDGAGYRIRTSDPLRVKQTLYR